MRKFLFLALLALASPAMAADLPQFLAARLDAITPASAPAFIASYDVKPGKSTFDAANANAAYTYDEALALCAFLATGDILRARRIGDALVWAQDHDRFYHDGRLRNAYAAGLAIDNPVKLPGYYQDHWIEDGYQAGSATGNNAWAGIALIRLYTATGDKRYGDAARRIGHWLIDVVGVKDGLPGGFEDFEPNPTVLTWRSTEHNIDAFALFRLLAKSYPQDGFSDAATQTESFVKRMWSGQRFEVGTVADGVTINKAYSALDAQILPLLALHPQDRVYLKALDYAKDSHGVPGGFDYTDKHDGVWAEGTAQAALLYRVLGDKKTAQQLIANREADAAPDGGIYAVGDLTCGDSDQLSTGLQLGNGGPKGSKAGEVWSYYRRVHIAPVSWLIMAEKGYNPLAAQ